MRRSGMLLPVSALPSKYGIGCFSREAYEFIDILKQSGQSLWQILPLGPTGYGDSPYQSFSTFAGNPYFIDLDQLLEAGLLLPEECGKIETGAESAPIDYEQLFKTRYPVLKRAYGRAAYQGILRSGAYQAFCREQRYWLEDYALFMAVKEKFAHCSWEQWPDEIRRRCPAALDSCRSELSEQIEFHKYMQYLFSIQWRKLKRYANDSGIQIIGDIPIYVAFDSADTWSHPELFQLDRNLQPTAVAGCPPDGFSATGQLWGNPLYDWTVHKEGGFEWWARRVGYCMNLYDITRIDHFRGFDEYYAIPYGHTTAEKGRWMPGPGMLLFASLQQQLGGLNIIAEDLGFLTDTVRKLLADSGYPGMKVLQFAFDSREASDYLPHNYQRNCVVYTGTHDNATLREWFQELNSDDRELALTYLRGEGRTAEQVHWDIICLALSSVADTCIIPVQDFLYLGAEARINTPSTLGGNWIWRMPRGGFNKTLMDRIRKLTKIYGRSIDMDE